MLKNKIKKLIAKHGFVKNVSILTGGTVFAQGLMVLALPILTRIYSPSDFSLLAVYVAIIGVITVFACLRYNIAIPIPSHDADALSLLFLSLGVSTILSGVLASLVIIYSVEIGYVLEQEALVPYLWMIPIGVLAGAYYNALQFWASRKKRFGLISKTKINQAMGGVGTQAGIGVVSSTPFGLIFGHMIFSGLGVAGLVKSVWVNDRASLKDVSCKRVVLNASKYKRFPLYSVPESLFNTAAIQVPIIIIAGLAIGAEAGYLMLAMRVMGMPMGLIGSSVSQVYLAEAPSRLRDGTLNRFTIKTMFVLMKVGAPPLLFVGAISPFIFGFIFGDDWERAGVVVAWLTPWFILQFIASPVSMIMHVTGKQHIAMWLQFFGLIVRLGAVLVAAHYYEDHLVEVFALANIGFYFVYLLAIVALIRKMDARYGESEDT